MKSSCFIQSSPYKLNVKIFVVVPQDSDDDDMSDDIATMGELSDDSDSDDSDTESLASSVAELSSGMS